MNYTLTMPSKPALKVVQPATQLAGSIVLGLKGPQGDPGPSGAGFDFVQSTPAAVWTINHNLGFRPNIQLLGAGGQEIDGDVANPTVNQTVVTFSTAIAGFARLT